MLRTFQFYGRVLIAFLCFTTLEGESSGGVSDNKASRLKVAIKPTSRVFESADKVLLQLTISNCGEPCDPVFIDPVLKLSPSGGRHSLLTLEFLNKSGKSVEKERVQFSDFAALHPSKLILLECGTLYGWYIRPAKEEWFKDWQYKLEKGEYRVRARLALTVRSYFIERDDLLEELAVFLGFSSPPNLDLLLPRLAEGTYETEEVSFEIKEDR